jgi:TPR repeat protein
MTSLQQCKELADQGDAEAQFKLGMMYENGLGVTKDYAEAYFWYWLSATKPAMAKVHPLGKRLTEDQIREAHRRAKEWVPTSAPKA